MTKLACTDIEVSADDPRIWSIGGIPLINVRNNCFPFRDDFSVYRVDTGKPIAIDYATKEEAEQAAADALSFGG